MKLNTDDFVALLRELNDEFEPRRQELVAMTASWMRTKRDSGVSSYGQCAFTPPVARSDGWSVRLPSWCADQRNQMTGPADDTKIVSKLMNSGSPGVMLDLEDSIVPENMMAGLLNSLSAIHGCSGFSEGQVTFIRPPGIRVSNGSINVYELSDVSASLYATAFIALSVNVSRLQHPPCFYIPKSESAAEALWWRDLFHALADIRGWPSDYIKCMALVESFSLAYEMEEFAFNLRDHLLGLTFGRWDYIASIAHWNMADPGWCIPDRDTLSQSALCIESVSRRLVDVCHRHGLLAIGGMTALFPSRKDAAMNERALDALRVDKQREASLGFDGAWTGHPDQNDIAITQFPSPNQLDRPSDGRNYQMSFSVPLAGVYTLKGTSAAIRTAIAYAYGRVNGKGASLLDGYMEDLATYRMCCVMLAARMKHWETISWDQPVALSFGALCDMFRDEAEFLITRLGLWNEPAEVIAIKRVALDVLEAVTLEDF